MKNLLNPFLEDGNISEEIQTPSTNSLMSHVPCKETIKFLASALSTKSSELERLIKVTEALLKESDATTRQRSEVYALIKTVRSETRVRSRSRDRDQR